MGKQFHYRVRRDGATYEVVETFGDFRLYKDGNFLAVLGDGVDMFFDKDDRPIRVGTSRFYHAMRMWLKSDIEEIQEAYEAVFKNVH